jgi:HEPN domain-containing protein
MKADTRERVKYAEGDYDAACLLMRSRKKSTTNAIGFPCQPWVEKYLKARLEEAGLAIPKMHLLPALLKLLAPVEPLRMAFTPTARHLTSYAVEFRYPGHSVARQDARKAMNDCRAIRKEVRASLGLPAK